jgi:hypothetical protein
MTDLSWPHFAGLLFAAVAVILFAIIAFFKP